MARNMFQSVSMYINKALLLVLLALCPSFVCGQSEEAMKTTEQMERFFYIYRSLLEKYYIKVPPENLFKNAIQGMMEILDPYTRYEEIKDEKVIDLGIKWHYDPDIHRLVVKHVEENSGAEAAGIQAGDVLMGINKISVEECLSNQDNIDHYSEKINEMLRSEVNKDKVRLTMMRKTLGSNGVFDKKERNFDVKVIDYKNSLVPFGCLIDSAITYIRINEFAYSDGESGNTYSEFYNKLKKLQYQYRNIKEKNGSAQQDKMLTDTMPIFIDLRGNGGGVVKLATKIAGIFLKDSTVICYLQGEAHRDQDQTIRTDGTPEFTTNPIVFLVDSASASASELISGAMQDINRGIVIGQRTYGKGLMQVSLQPNPEYPDLILNLTIGRYFLPSGKCVQRWDYSPLIVGEEKKEIYSKDEYGITPDSIVKDTTSAFLLTLEKQNAFFNSCVDLRLRYPEIINANPRTFELTDNQLEYFKVRLLENGYMFETQVWKDYEQMKNTLGQYEVVANYNQLEEELLNQLSQKLEKNNEALRVMVAKKIMKMYRTAEDYYLYSLRHDNVLDVAIAVMNKGLYETIMDKKPMR